MNLYLNTAQNLIKNGFAHIFVGTFLNKAIAMISSVIVARIVDKTDYAYLTYSETLYGYLTLFLGLGMSSSLLKFCSSKNITSADKAYLTFSLKYGVLFEVVITTIFCTVICFITLPFPHSKFYVVATALYPTLYYMYDLLITYIRAKQLNKEYAWYSFLYSIITCASTIVLVFLLSAIGVVYARYISLFFMIGLLLYLNKDRHTQISVGHLEKKEIRAFMAMALSLMIANALSRMMPVNENLLVSNIIADETTTSNFRVASLFPQMVILVAQSVMIYYFPILAEMDNKQRDSRSLVIKVELLNVVLVSISAVLGILLTPWLIVTFYGQKYADVVTLTYLLWVVHGLNAALRTVPINVLIAIQKYKFNLYMNALSVIVQFVLDWYFLVKYGLYGVLYGTFIVYLLTGVLYWMYYFKVSTIKNKEK